MKDLQPTNEDIARELEAIADLLDALDADPFRIRAYRQGALQIRHTDMPAAGLVREGKEDCLQDIPDIGESLSRLIAEYVRTGKTNLHLGLLGKVSPVDAFRQVPGLGRDLARRIVDSLGVSTLEELEQAAHDGRLAQVEGFGPRRVEMIQDILAGMLIRKPGRARRGASDRDAKAPPVSLLLKIDHEYRKKAEADKLRRIAPKRFNPEHRDWLPVMAVRREGWDFTALYSNTARAHEMGKIRDWVVIYYGHEGRGNQVTVVTDTVGDLGKKRVVRGREPESLRYYYSHTADKGAGPQGAKNRH